MPDVVDLIEADHREVERLLEILHVVPTQRLVMLPSLAALLIAHHQAEESIVHPVAPEQVGETEQSDHARVEELLARLRTADPEGAGFDATLTELTKIVTHHVEVEEGALLPALRRQLDAQHRVDLAADFARARAEQIRLAAPASTPAVPGQRTGSPSPARQS